MHIENRISEFLPVTHGIPQGSVLGPILFALYVNDLPDSIDEGQTIIYADDTAVLLPGSDIPKLEQTANRQLVNIEQWFSNNRLTLNANKTNYVVFSSSAKRMNKSITLKIGGEEITKVQTCKYLGVTLDASLHYKEHIKIVCSKLSRACFTLYQARYHFPLSTLKAIYFGTFHCHLTYCVET